MKILRYIKKVLWTKAAMGGVGRVANPSPKFLPPFLILRDFPRYCLGEGKLFYSGKDQFFGKKI